MLHGQVHEPQLELAAFCLKNNHYDTQYNIILKFCCSICGPSSCVPRRFKPPSTIKTSKKHGNYAEIAEQCVILYAKSIRDRKLLIHFCCHLMIFLIYSYFKKIRWPRHFGHATFQKTQSKRSLEHFKYHSLMRGGGGCAKLVFESREENRTL